MIKSRTGTSRPGIPLVRQCEDSPAYDAVFGIVARLD